MILLEHSTYDEHSVGANLGAPEYSYWFVRKAFRPLLQKFGVVVPVADPEREADKIYASALAHGQDCVLFAFNPPQYTPVGLTCPVTPVFAWEFDAIPDETWNANPREDWRHVLSATGLAITHSSASAEAVRRSMGPDFPVWSIPAPVFDGRARHAQAARGRREPFELVLEGAVTIDVAAVDLSLFSGERAPRDGARALRLLRGAGGEPPRLRLEGVVYTAVFNPVDGRKNWVDLIAGFTRAFRNTSDAVLLLKLTHADLLEGALPVLEHIAKLGPVAGRIVLVHGMLSDVAYGAMIDATSYVVNTSNGEGQCLPLMEFMSAGRPGVAPRHTAMIDYLSDEDGFVVSSHERPGFWPHDERQAWRCRRHEISFADLVRRFRESYHVAVSEPARYARLSAAATQTLRGFCSEEVTTARLEQVFQRLRASRPAAPSPRVSGKASA